MNDANKARSAIPVASTRWQPAVIERVEPRTRRVTSIFLRTALARHEAGQHIDVRLTAPDGYAAQRSYSIASAPGAELIELAIEATNCSPERPATRCSTSSSLQRGGHVIAEAMAIGGLTPRPCKRCWRVGCRIRVMSTSADPTFLPKPLPAASFRTASRRIESGSSATEAPSDAHFGRLGAAMTSATEQATEVVNALIAAQTAGALSEAA